MIDRPNKIEHYRCGPTLATPEQILTSELRTALPAWGHPRKSFVGPERKSSGPSEALENNRKKRESSFRGSGSWESIFCSPSPLQNRTCERWRDHGG